jgi:hypothetical protein
MPLTIRPKQGCRWDLVALGEVMLRFDPGDKRVTTARCFDVYEGGGEYNVARDRLLKQGITGLHRRRAISEKGRYRKAAEVGRSAYRNRLQLVGDGFYLTGVHLGTSIMSVQSRVAHGASLQRGCALRLSPPEGAVAAGVVIWTTPAQPSSKPPNLI